MKKILLTILSIAAFSTVTAQNASKKANTPTPAPTATTNSTSKSGATTATPAKKTVTSSKTIAPHYDTAPFAGESPAEGNPRSGDPRGSAYSKAGKTPNETPTGTIGSGPGTGGTLPYSGGSGNTKTAGTAPAATSGDSPVKVTPPKNNLSPDKY